MIALHLEGSGWESFSGSSQCRRRFRYGPPGGHSLHFRQDSSLKYVAHTDASYRNEQETPFLTHALQTAATLPFLHVRKGTEVFEVLKSFSVDQTPAGLIRIGFLRRNPAILSQSRRTFFSPFCPFWSSDYAITLIW